MIHEEPTTSSNKFGGAQLPISWRQGCGPLAGAKPTERTISELRLKLMAARSTDEVRSLRDQIFMTEQARWITPGASLLKTKWREAVGIEQIQQALAPSVVLLEYVIADPTSYCLTISRNGSRIVRSAARVGSRRSSGLISKL